MPYIKIEDRDQVMEFGATTPGQLNYAITCACIAYLPDSPNYSQLNEVIGILECVKQEFYRRVVVPYERMKIAENGDVYT